MGSSNPTPPRKKMCRIEHANHARFLTFSCYHRLPLFDNPKICDLFVEHLVQTRERHRFHLYAWVVMPEHVHLLLWPQLPEHPVSNVLRDLKRNLGQQVIERWRTLRAPILSRLLASDGTTRFWQRGGGHDRNIFSDEEFFEKLNYIHNNPVERGLVKKAEDWKWSSARWYISKSSDEHGPAMDPLPPRRP